MLALAVTDAKAQQTVVIGSNAAPGITVNEDVLRSLEEPQSAPLPRLQLPGAAPLDQPIHLRPPPGVFDQGAGRLTLSPPAGASATPYRLHVPTGRYLPVAPPLTAPTKPRRQLATPAAPSAPKVALAPPPAKTSPPLARILSRSVAPELIVVPPPPKAPQRKTATAPGTPASKTPPPLEQSKATEASKMARVAPPAVPKAKPEKIVPPPPAAAKPKRQAALVAPPAPKIPMPPAAATPAPPPVREIETKTPPKPTAIPVPPPVQTEKRTQPAQKQAALTPPSAPVPSGKLGYGTLLTLKFSGGASALTAGDKNQLAELSGRLTGSSDRLQLKAYASAEGDTASAARRLSLSRALTVRSQLIAQGIRSTRIDVRALGIADSGDPNRVDILLLKRP